MYKFNSLTNAKKFQDRAFDTMLIILGDDDKFWVMLPAQAERLANNGYEYAA